jgi:hypothetical protein
MKFRPNLKFFLLVAIGLVILARLNMAFFRYFDSDEFSHLHWMWLVAHGKIMYKDFFFYNFPFFQFSFAPIFWLPDNPALVIIVRVIELILLCLTAFTLYRLSVKLTGKSEIGVFAAFIFAVFPMTFDKTIDVRPDILMMLTYLIAMLLILNHNLKFKYKYEAVGAIAAYGLLVLPKVIFALPAFLILVLIEKVKVNEIIKIIIGGAIVGFIFLIYLLGTGTFNQAFISITRDSVAVNAGKTPFSPWKALSPWPLVYVNNGGPSWPWKVNTAIWVTAALGLIIYFTRKPKYGLFFICYFAVGILLLFLFPAPYLQYFYPFSIFGSLLSAYFIYCLIHQVEKFLPIPNLKNILIFLICLPLLYSFYIQYQIRVSPGMKNTEQMQVLADVIKMIKPNETVYDMVGSYVYRPDGYILCCHPYAEFVDRLAESVPTLKDSLIQNQTKFIVLDRTGLSLWRAKPEDLAFIKSSYLVSKRDWKFYTLGVQFRCVSGSCMQINIDSQAVNGQFANRFWIIIPETYTVSTDPAGLTAVVDGKTVNQPVWLNTGAHTFTIPSSVKTLTIQMER